MASTRKTALPLAAIAGMAFSAAVLAQAYPAKPIRMVLTYSGGIDAVTRVIAQRVGESLGQPVLVENQAGAGGAIGATTVARAAPVVANIVKRAKIEPQ